MRNYLQTVVDSTLHIHGISHNVQITWSVEESGDVADELLTVIDRHAGNEKDKAYDVLALTTHGSHGIEHWITGSVTEHILEGSTEMYL